MVWYAILPIVGWFVSGVTKYTINTLRYGRSAAKQRVGNGGFPSTHSTVVATPLAYIGFVEGVNTPIFSLGLALLMITVIDATGIRRALGEHAKRLNKLSQGEEQKALRESQGHTYFEVAGGIVLGTCIGAVFAALS